MTEFVEQPIYAQLSRIGKVLANPVRLRLLDLLDTEELTVEQVADLAGLPVKNTSAQLQQLRAAHLVSARRDGPRVFYRVAGPDVSAFLGRFHEFAEVTLADLRVEIEKHLGTAGQLAPVTTDELAALVRKDTVTVLDVRPAPDYEREHVPGALSIPLSRLPRRLGELDKRREIVAYCQGPYCVTSPDAVRSLASKGYQARILSGGWTAWVRSGRPRERPAAKPARR